MHPVWPMQRNNWRRAVMMSNGFKEFALALGILESVIKPVLFNEVWHASLGKCIPSFIIRTSSSAGRVLSYFSSRLCLNQIMTPVFSWHRSPSSFEASDSSGERREEKAGEERRRREGAGNGSDKVR